MLRTSIAIDTAHVSQWAENFRAEHGSYPFAGAETAAAATPAAPPPAPDAGAAPPAATPPPAGEPGGQGEPVSDVARLEGRIDDVIGRLGQIGDRLPQPEATPSAAQQQTSQMLTELFGTPPEGQPGVPGQPPPPGQQGPLAPDDSAFLEQMVQSGIDSRVRPALEQILTSVNEEKQAREAQRRATETREILAEYPQLNDAATRQTIVSEAQAYAQSLGLAPEMAGEPGFIELIYLAQQTIDRMQDENPATPGGSGSPLEQGAGAQPPQSQPGGENRAQQILDAGGPKNPVFGV